MNCLQHPFVRDFRRNLLCAVAILSAAGSLLAGDAALATDDPATTGQSTASHQTAETDESGTIRHRITGLFSPDREKDLRQVIERLPGITLVSIDFPYAEARFRYDAAEVFPGAKPEQVAERFDQLVRQASKSTFGVQPLCTVPREKLTRIEIPIAGLDCKGCCLAAYESIFRIEGVEQATASFKDGLVTALINPEQTEAAQLEAALEQRGVQLRKP